MDVRVDDGRRRDLVVAEEMLGQGDQHLELGPRAGLPVGKTGEGGVGLLALGAPVERIRDVRPVTRVERL